jgi:prenyltransferase beta subunit
MSLANREQNLADFCFTFWEGNALRLSGDFGFVTQVRLNEAWIS